MEKSWGEEKASDAIAGESEGWRGVKKKKARGNVKDPWHQDRGPVFVSVATDHSIVCLLRERGNVLRGWEEAGGGD